MKINVIQKRFKNGKALLLDGAMGTEILNRNIPTALPLWSAEALFTHPEIIQQIHEDYINAGAEIIITNTFATTERVFSKKGKGAKAKEATLMACRLAKEARSRAHAEENVLIAGSIAPLEDCYSPELTPPQRALDREHAAFAQALREGEVDVALIETMITIRETVAACRAAKTSGLAIAVSFCCNDNLELLGGESLADALQAIEPYDPLFVGVNCVSINTATKTIRHLRTLTDRPLSVYAQGDGEPDDDQGWKFNHKDRQSMYLDAAKDWLETGAQIIGGCCGTTPNDVRALGKIVRS